MGSIIYIHIYIYIGPYTVYVYSYMLKRTGRHWIHRLDFEIALKQCTPLDQYRADVSQFTGWSSFM